MSTDTPLSRASPLPHLFCSAACTAFGHCLAWTPQPASSWRKPHKHLFQPAKTVTDDSSRTDFRTKRKSLCAV